MKGQETDIGVSVQGADPSCKQADRRPLSQEALPLGLIIMSDLTPLKYLDC